jgi:hypothetical protein
VAFDAGFTGSARFRNPWPRETVGISEGDRHVRSDLTGDVLEFAVEQGKRYVLKPATARRALSVGSERQARHNSGPRFLGQRSIGLGSGTR